MKKLLAVFVVFCVIFSFTTLFTAAASSDDIKVFIDGQQLKLDVPPVIVNGRIMVPFRTIFETLGAEVSWDALTQTVSARKGNITIILQINNETALVNKIQAKLDAPPVIINGRTLVPLRFVSESMNCNVNWSQDSRTVLIGTLPITGVFPTITATPAPTIKPQQTPSPTPTPTPVQKEKEFVFQGVSIGDSEQQVTQKLGQPVRKDLSEYGFYWYIYNKNYSNYIQVGVQSGKVVGLYTDSSGWTSSKGIKTGTKRSDVGKLFGKTLTSIQKGSTIYHYDTAESDIFVIDGCYATIFYDLHNNTTVTSVQLIDKNTEESLKGYYGKASDALRTTYEKEVFDLANAIRTRFGMPVFQWDDKAATAARLHSEDMVKRNYFDHYNPDGKSPFDRMGDAGINSYSVAAENIAAGQTSAIFAHEGWMNSEGHRSNILGECARLGVGVSFGGSMKIYYTQDFYSPF